VTQNYINPSIDIIKAKGVFSADTINATLLAFTNSAAECFIIMNSIFFGVSDIGISTVVQQAAFSQLVIQGGFYFLAEQGTRIDWWVITRDTIFLIIYLIVITIQLSSNNITITNAVILVVLYFVHILLMKFNTLYEVAIKKNVARGMEIKELTYVANTNIDHFHRNLNSRSITIEMLKNVNYRVEDKYIVIDETLRKRIKDPCVVIADEEIPFSMMDDRSFLAKMLWKKASIKIIIRIQAYKFFEKTKRNFKSTVDLTRILPYLADEKGENSMRGFESNRYLEGEQPLFPRNEANFGKAGSNSRKFNSLMAKMKMNRSGQQNVSDKMSQSQIDEGEEEDDASQSRISGGGGSSLG
jgi:Ca2+/Na+ antiporter